MSKEKILSYGQELKDVSSKLGKELASISDFTDTDYLIKGYQDLVGKHIRVALVEETIKVNKEAQDGE